MPKYVGPRKRAFDGMRRVESFKTSPGGVYHGTFLLRPPCPQRQVQLCTLSYSQFRKGPVKASQHLTSA
eukprot:scaffold205065_cov17-Tisochrysis_lutea.AAC.3